MGRRAEYYALLEQTQSGTGDATGWIAWFAEMLGDALRDAQDNLSAVLAKTAFWQRFAAVPVNALTGVSRAGAWRDIADLLEKGMLRTIRRGGRGAAYDVAVPADARVLRWSRSRMNTAWRDIR